MGFKRSEARMKEIEKKLRAGMERNGITGAAEEEIVQSIASFALYGFPESHAASFALLAYASAYLKCHYLAAFTAALLNNQPMGFYCPATIVKDAERHGLRIRPIDVTRSDWPCTLEVAPGFSPAPAESKGACPERSEGSTGAGLKPGATGRKICVRLGMRYAKGLREEAAQAIVRERARGHFTSIDDLARRVPELRKPELVMLAEIGALNWVGEGSPLRSQISHLKSQRGALPDRIQHATRHRRDALWQVERAARPAGPLFESGFPNSELRTPNSEPLAPMTPEERLVADFCGTGLTVGPHPMAYRRAEMKALGVRAAAELGRIPAGKRVRIAGGVIARQRPGTAKGFVFLSLEDETGISNAIITPDVFEQNRLTVVREQFLMVEGKLEKQDNVISVRAERVCALAITRAETSSHDFY